MIRDKCPGLVAVGLCTLLLACSAEAASFFGGKNVRVVFPRDPAVLDARRDFGAKGDGKTDDTAALQAAIEESSGKTQRMTRVLFIPNGTYRVSDTLVVKKSVGPWVYGESRDGVVIRLTDGVGTNVHAVLRTHPKESGKTSADWFMRNFHNLTIDVGNNPDVDGIRFYGNNSGIIQNVRVIGRGKVGINAGFYDQNGPNLIQDCEIDGFETGIRSAWSWGGTISRVTIRNCRSEGVYASATAVGVEDLVVENTPCAGVREINFGGVTWPVKVREKRGDETRTLGNDKESGWIGWALYRGAKE